MNLKFLVIIDPKNINVKLFMWIVGIISAITIWAIYVGSEDKDAFMKAKGISDVSVDTESKLPIVDLRKQNLLGEQSFHAAIQDKEFLVQGVETTIFLTQKNPEKTLANKEDYVLVSYSDILNIDCLKELKKKIDASDAGIINLKELVVSTCGSKVYPISGSTSAKKIYDSSDISDLCSGAYSCAPCVITSSSEVDVNQCKENKITFIDKSQVMETQGKKWVAINYQPAQKLPYMKYPPRQ